MVKGHPSSAPVRLDLVRLKLIACGVGGYETFAELAAASLAKRFLRQGRRHEARRILQAFLRRHGSTQVVLSLLAAADDSMGVPSGPTPVK